MTENDTSGIKSNNKVISSEEWENQTKYIRRCKVWGAQYKQIKLALEQQRRKYKNGHIRLITMEIRQNVNKGNMRKVWPRLNELKRKGGDARSWSSHKKYKGGYKRTVKCYLA